MAEAKSRNGGRRTPVVDETEPEKTKEKEGVCLLNNKVYSVGERVSHNGRVLYCAPPGAWIDYGPSDPTRND